MPRLKPFLVALTLLFVGNSCFAATNLILRIDTLISAKGLGSTNGIISIADSDTIFVQCRLINHSNAIVNDTNTTFAASDSIIPLPAANFPAIFGHFSLRPGDSIRLAFDIVNTNSTPLPVLLPNGSSVVIWPICIDSTVKPDSARFTLTYTVADIADVNNLLNSVKYDQQRIYLSYNSSGQKVLELYDATGRKVYEHQSAATNDEIAWGLLPSAVYILRVQQGVESISVKLVHQKFLRL